MEIRVCFLSPLKTYDVTLTNLSKKGEYAEYDPDATYRLELGVMDLKREYVPIPELLKALLDKLGRARIPPIARSPMMLDVGSYYLTIVSESSSVSYAWNSLCERGWRPLADIAQLLFKMADEVESSNLDS